MKILYGARIASLSNTQLEPTADGRPPFGGTDQDLALINADGRRAVRQTADNCFVRDIWAINDQPLKNGLVMPTASVLAIARLANGSPVLANHDKGQFTSGVDALPLARVFRTRAEQIDAVTHAVLSVCFPATELTEELVGRMDGGAIAEASSSFYYARIDCSICGQPFGRCDHSPFAEYDGKVALGQVIDPYEYLETSLCWQGMANGTHFKIAASRGDEQAVFEKLTRRAPVGADVDELLGALELVDPAAAAEIRALEELFTTTP